VAYQEIVKRASQLAWSGRWAEAAAAYREALAEAPEDAAVRLQLALTLERLGQREEALREYQAVERLQPRNVAALRRVASLAAALSDGDEASRAWARLADLHREQGATADEVEARRHVVMLRPDDVESWERLADALERGGGAEAAASELVRLGRACEQRGEVNGARAAYQVALRIAPGLAEASRALASLRETPGYEAPAGRADLEGVVDATRVAPHHDPSAAPGWGATPTDVESPRATPSAAAISPGALGPARHARLVARGAASLVAAKRRRVPAEAERPYDVLADLQEVEEARRDDLLYLLAVANGYIGGEQCAAAADTLYQVLAAFPGYLPAHLLLAEVLWGLGNEAAAIEKCRTVADTYLARSNEQGARLALGQMWMFEPEASLSVALANWLAQADPLPFVALSETLEGQGRHRAARALLEGLAVALRGLGREQEAAAVERVLRNLPPWRQGDE